MRNSSFLCTWLKWFALILMIGCALVVPLLSQHEHDRMEMIHARHTAQLHMAEHRIAGMFQERQSDLRVLTQSRGVRSYLSTASAQDPSETTDLFQAFERAYGIYDQIRLIGLDGQEKIRVNYTNGQCHIAPPSDLQDKGSRYYFQEAIRLPVGDVYISPLDLNVEQGQVQQPRKPMIRFSSPVPDKSGTVRGVLVLNYLAGPMLDSLLPPPGTRLAEDHFLVNTRGDYLLSTACPEKEFGFMFDREQDRFSVDYPDAWEAAQEGKTFLRTRQGLFLMNTTPVPVSTINASAIDSKEGSPGNYWYLFQLIPNQNLNATSILYGPARWIWLCIFLFTAMLISGLAAVNTHNKRSLKQTAGELKNTIDAIDYSGIDLHWVDFETGRMLKVNHSTEKLLGYSKDELLKKYIWDIDQTLTPDLFRQHRDETRTRGQAEFETVHTHKDGHRIPVLMTVIYREHTTELPAHFVGMAQDISERIAGQAELQRTTEQLKQAQQIAHLGVWEHNHETDAQTWSDEIYTMLGLDPATTEPAYETFIQVIHPEDRDRVVSMDEELLRTGGLRKTTFRFLLANGQIKWAEAQCKTELNQEGHPARSVGTVYDITQQKEADEKFRTYMRLASDSIHILDPAGNVMECSQSFADSLGYTYEEALHLNFKDWDCGIPHDRLVPLLRDLMESPQTIETKHRRKDGSVLDVQISTQSIEIDGRPYLYASARDITEEKKELLQMYQTLEERTNSYAVKYLPDTDDLWCSETLFKIFELPPTPHPTKSMFFQHMAPNSQQLVRSVIRNQKKADYTLTITTPGGTTKYLSETAIPRRTSEGRFEFLIAGSDVTQKTLAKEKEKRLIESLNEAQKIAKTGSWEFIQGTDYLVVSEEFKAIYGTEKDHFPLDELLDTIHPADRIILQENLKSFASQQHLSSMQYRIVVNGTIKHIEVQWENRTDDSGNTTLTVGTSQDITEKIAAEKRARERDALEQAKNAAEAANQAKSKFLATMSHEIRTPLNAIINSAYLLEHTDLTKEQRTDIKTIEVSGKHLLSSINDTLDFAKIEAGEMALEAHAFSLTELVNDLSAQGALLCRGKDIAMDTPPLSEDLPPFLIGDSTRLRQILLNLLGNAVKFTEKGQISLTIQRSDLPKRSRDITLRFSISDTGIGIRSKALEKLFTPFTQADMSTSRKYGGTGLGLSIVKQLTELMGGTITVDSTPGVGSTFQVDLPFDIGEDIAQPTDSTTTDKRPLEGLRILAVDDGDVNKMVIKRLLNHFAAHPTICSSGEEAIELLKQQPEAFDLILMDIQMPGMNGRDATTYIQQKLNIHVPVVALTGGVTEFEQERALAAGMSAFLSKPIHPAKLVQTILQQLTPSSSPPE